jgi:26S proteasome regulatory subunit N10
VQELLVKVGKKLKKNNVSVDVVSFGASAEENKEKLEALVAAVNKDENSHFVEVPAGSNLADFLLSSPVVSQVSAGETSGGAGGIGYSLYHDDPRLHVRMAN